MLWVRGFRDHTISGRGFNLFKPLRRHFRATPFLPSGPLARRSRRRKRLGRAQCERRLRRRVRPDVGRSWKARTWRFPVSRLAMKSSSTKSGVSEREILKFRNVQMPPMGWRHGFGPILRAHAMTAAGGWRITGRVKCHRNPGLAAGLDILIQLKDAP